MGKNLSRRDFLKFSAAGTLGFAALGAPLVAAAEGIVSDQPQRNLSGKTHKGNAVIVRICKSRNNICGSRSACNKTHPHLSGGFCISFCLM